MQFTDMTPSIHTISPTFVIIRLESDRLSLFNERRAFIMPKRISVKPILELRAAGISMRKIEADYSAQVDQSFRLC